MRTHVKSFPQFRLRGVSLANEFGMGRFAETTKREAAGRQITTDDFASPRHDPEPTDKARQIVARQTPTLADGESWQSQTPCGKSQ
jgi:hypothetical protein